VELKPEYVPLSVSLFYSSLSSKVELKRRTGNLETLGAFASLLSKVELKQYSKAK